ncbi:MAG: hypothetical protein NT132_04510 [Microbacterium sp.]|uniref:hypothetical protein n=1 Tax=Microbacterium sp. TaxID=51671 RepID=UPI0026262363|nr:hypothetical protein [Microbacterium sp.]MCX6501660.1 hypothetical protein [Microbacterium sp.]
MFALRNLENAGRAARPIRGNGSADVHTSICSASKHFEASFPLNSEEISDKEFKVVI